MSRSIKPRFKCLKLLRNNIWNTSKPLDFKRLKWKKLKRLLQNHNYTKVWKKKKIFNKRTYLYRFYRFRLNLRKTFFSMYGTYKIKKFTYLIKKFSHKGNLIKARKYLFNKIIVGNLEVDNLLYLMRMFENKLIVSLFRFGIFNTIFSTNHFIRLGGIKINNIVIKNPFYTLRESDIISINRKFFYSILSFKRKYLKINIYRKKNRPYLKRFPGVYQYKIKNVIYWYKKFKYIYSSYPYEKDMDKQKFIWWDLVVFLIKLKRL